MKRNSLVAFALLVLVQTGVAQGGAAPPRCTRDELKSAVTKYLGALFSRDTTAVNLAATLRYTENGRVLQSGEGLWRTGGKAVFTRSALDTARCGVVTQVILEEAGRNIIVGLRLRLDAEKRISEVEHIVAREKEFAFKPQGILDTRDQDWEALLDPAQRMPRAAMVTAANDYFDMFVADPAVSVPFAKPCERWENGTLTTRGDCSPKGLVLVHPERRVPIVDTEAGIAVAFVLFNGALPDLHMFRFRNGQVDLITSVIGPRGVTSTGWPDDKSLRRRVVPPGEVQSQAPSQPGAPTSTAVVTP